MVCLLLESLAFSVSGKDTKKPSLRYIKEYNLASIFFFFNFKILKN